MKKWNRSKGQVGEEIAASYLRKKGYKILEQNFSTKFGELDLICLDRSILVFVEVKLKVGEQFGTPEEMVNHHKLNQVQRTAQAFLLRNLDLEKQYPQYRIDVVAVVTDKGGSTNRIDHYENVGF